MTTPYSMTVEDAVVFTGKPRSTIFAAIQRGDLVARYIDSRPVIPTAELREWIDSAPTESPRKAKSA